ncbi:MAG: hypothetical protein R6V14_04535 [Halanaerobiales bacterium]
MSVIILNLYFVERDQRIQEQEKVRDMIIEDFLQQKKPTSLCMEYANAKKISYNPLEDTYSFNNITIHKNILLESCGSRTTKRKTKNN